MVELVATSLHTCIDDDNSHLAFSAASLSLCMAMVSLVMSTPCFNYREHKMVLKFKSLEMTYSVKQCQIQITASRCLLSITYHTTR